MSIKHIKHRDLNKELWDECIYRSNNGLIYANSWYLDIVSPGWEGLVYGDYQAVMPLTVKKKYGLSYISHPLFSQQLGLFSTIDGLSVDDFIEKIPKVYRRILIRLNNAYKPTITSTTRRNYILKLSSLAEVESAFNQNTKRNLKKVNHAPIITDVDVTRFINLKKENSAAILNDSEWDLMKRLIEGIILAGNGEFKAVYKDDRLISAVFFSAWKNRICYLFSVSTEEGKEERASFSIVYDVIKQQVGKNKILDFEGSMDDNIARFFKGFGATEELYYEVRRKF